MPNERWLLAALGILGAAGVCAAAAAAVVPRSRDIGRAPVPAAGAGATRPRYPADSLEAVVIERDVFRFGRRPASLRFAPVRDGVPAEEAVIQRPELKLTGLIQGTPPAAIIEGLPGEPARVVRPGDRFGDLRVAAVNVSTVRVTGPDTTWVLELRP